MSMQRRVRLETVGLCLVLASLVLAAPCQAAARGARQGQAPNEKVRPGRHEHLGRGRHALGHQPRGPVLPQ